MMQFVLRGAGTAFPERILDNEQLGRELDVDPASIEARTGVRERRIAGPGETASSLGAEAALEALARAGTRAIDVDLVLLSTYTPDNLLCPAAPKLALRIGATRAGAFDLNAACSGGVTALITAASFIASHTFSKILIVASDLTTRFIRPDDAKTRLIFGDGAAAMLIEPCTDRTAGAWEVLASRIGADGSGADLFRVPPGKVPTVEMNGRAVFRFGVESGLKLVSDLCLAARLGPDDVDRVIPHQANRRIIHSMIERSQIPGERWIINIERYGNTASSSVLTAFSELIDRGEVTDGFVVVLAAFGAGLTWSGLALRQIG